MKPGDDDDSHLGPPAAAAGDPADRRAGRDTRAARAADRRGHAAAPDLADGTRTAHRPPARRRRPRARRDRRREHRPARRPRHRRAARPAHGARGPRARARRRPHQGQRRRRPDRDAARRVAAGGARPGWRGRLSARMAAGGGLLALFFAVGIAEALFAYDGFRELARFRESDPALLREGAPALSAIVIALLIAVGQKAVGKNLRLAHTRERGAGRGGRQARCSRARPVYAARALRRGARDHRHRPRAVVRRAERAHDGQQRGAGAPAGQPGRRRARRRSAPARPATDAVGPDPGIYFLVSSAVFLLGIGVAYLLVEPAREAREKPAPPRRGHARAPRRAAPAARVGGRRPRHPARGDRDDGRQRQAPDAPGGGAASRGRVPAARRRVPAPVRHVDARAATTPFPSMLEVGEAHHAQADLARDDSLTVPDKLADVDALIAELLGRNMSAPKAPPQ